MTEEQLAALMEAAAERGSDKALAKVGLAAADRDSLRAMLSAFDGMRTAIGAGVVRIVQLVMVLVVLGFLFGVGKAFSVVTGVGSSVLK